MEDNKEYSNPARWITQPGDLVIIDEDGTRTRIGEPSPETLALVERLKRERRERETKRETEGKTP
jgi:hypothetical protein